MDRCKRLLTAKDCASAAGVTVRALRHYEKIGLIAPLRGDNGYRHYRPNDVVQVLAIRLLQEVGLSLTAVKRVLMRHETDLAGLMATQERTLEKERRRLDRAIAYTRRARSLLERDGDLQLSDLLSILESSNMNRLRKAFEGLDPPELTEAQKADLASRHFTAEDQDRVSARWATVFAEAESLVGSDPSGPQAQAMAREARQLVAMFTQGDPGLHRTAGAMWDKAWADPDRAKHIPISKEGWDFLQAAQAALDESA